ncbi:MULTISPECIES: AraC family transcriptional regulator [Deinococcus]|uniref:AraC family transcriptional regulator n=1 Tax=Deinococcus TaxID=1298 RepID=UPI0018DF8E52|nr:MULTISPECIES: helix-turn-helix domain-containing protein [Deinococcus]MBI0445139.1 AraC family transcriptional regulator [Deinococcus sp. DB0503]
MAYREFLPDPRLRSLVRLYYEVEEQHAPGEEEHRFLPERSVRLTFYAGDSWHGSPVTGELEPMSAASLFGMSLEPLRVVSRGPTRALGVELYPWGARQLFGWAIGTASLDLLPGYGAVAREICALVTLGDWEGARSCLEAWLLELAAERAREAGAGVRAAARLYGSLGTARIRTLAEELDLSPRQLERAFREEVGVPAKTLARLIRFEEVHNRLWVDPATPLAPLAYELGFSDQAHLTREFRALSHMTPGTFARFSRLRVRGPVPQLEPEARLRAPGRVSPYAVGPALTELELRLEPAEADSVSTATLVP